MCVSNVSSCSQLFQANHSVFGSSQGSSTEDLFTDSIDSCDLDITEKVETQTHTLMKMQKKASLISLETLIFPIDY